MIKHYVFLGFPYISISVLSKGGCKLLLRKWDFLEKLTVTQIAKKILSLYWAEALLMTTMMMRMMTFHNCLQNSWPDVYLELGQSSPLHHIRFLSNMHFNIIPTSKPNFTACYMNFSTLQCVLHVLYFNLPCLESHNKWLMCKLLLYSPCTFVPFSITSFLLHTNTVLIPPSLSHSNCIYLRRQTKVYSQNNWHNRSFVGFGGKIRPK